MLHLILFQPEIPQNTGNIGRMCAITGCRLHLIHPLGFEISDKHLKRAGMDYWQSLDVHHHASWQAFETSPSKPEGALYLFTTRASKVHWQAEFSAGDGLVFGNEGSGVPQSLHEQFGERRLKLPQWDTSLRSLNLATAAGIATYEALRQCVEHGTLDLPQ